MDLRVPLSEVDADTKGVIEPREGGFGVNVDGVVMVPEVEEVIS